MMMKPEDPAAPTTKIVDTVALEERVRACVRMVRRKVIVILGFVPLFKTLPFMFWCRRSNLLHLSPDLVDPEALISLATV